VENQSEQYYSAGVARKKLGLPKSTLHYLTIQGKIPAVKVGHRWKYPRKYFDQINRQNPFYEEREAPSTRVDQDVDMRVTKKRWMTFPSVEQRKYPRLTTKVPCHIIISDYGKKHLLASGNIQNISESGVLIGYLEFFIPYRSAKVHEHIEIKIASGEVWQGVVRRIQEEEWGRKTLQGLAVEFDCKQPSVRQRILAQLG